MLYLLQLLIQSTGPALEWGLILLAIVVGAFVLFVGVTLGVALFHPMEAVRKNATSILKVLLAAFTRRGVR